MFSNFFVKFVNVDFFEVGRSGDVSFFGQNFRIKLCLSGKGERGRVTSERSLAIAHFGTDFTKGERNTGPLSLN